MKYLHQRWYFTEEFFKKALLLMQILKRKLVKKWKGHTASTQIHRCVRVYQSFIKSLIKQSVSLFTFCRLFIIVSLIKLCSVSRFVINHAADKCVCVCVFICAWLYVCVWAPPSPSWESSIVPHTHTHTVARRHRKRCAAINLQWLGEIASL